MSVSNADIDQLVCDYHPENTSRNGGFGPIASSCHPGAEVSLFNLASSILRPPGHPAESDSIAYERLSSGQELIVRRIAAVDTLARANVLSQALVGAHGQLSAELALGLDQADWPMGDAVSHVRLGQRLRRVDLAQLRRRGYEGAARLRQLSRDGALRDVLHHLATWVLTSPDRRLSVASSLMGGHPRAVLLGLVDMLSWLVPGHWSFSTLESAESHAYRLIVMPEWPRQGSPDYGRLRLGGQPAPEGPAHAAASLLVARYQEYGLPGLEELGRDRPWAGMGPDERCRELTEALTHLGAPPRTAPHPAEPTPLVESAPPVEPAPSVEPAPPVESAPPVEPVHPAAAASARYAFEGGEELAQSPATAAGQQACHEAGAGHDQAADPTRAAGAAEPSSPGPGVAEPVVHGPEGQAPVAGAPVAQASGGGRLAPPLSPGFRTPPVQGQTPEGRIRDIVGFVTRLFRPRDDAEGRDLMLELENRVGGWNGEEIETACLTALDHRLGLAAPERGREPGPPEFLHDPQHLFDVLVRTALGRKQAALAWAVFLRQEHAAALTDPLHSVLQRMFDLYERKEIDIHAVFFVVMGGWAIPRALGLRQPGESEGQGTVPPRPVHPPDVPPRWKSALRLLGRGRPAAAVPARHAGHDVRRQGRAEGLAEDLRRLATALGVIVGICLAFVVVVMALTRLTQP
ncbi:hypothetical protein RKE30_14585 [Streptomyces sp. Li-HN-5-11]|uniref:hypothetical protein n=1 Tax=Streptomyces sp. Li-HN-5-11 TaxID=3075432 RepID=UPI0028AE4A63|nr:hypothetical protein [Streptomyces sp. Li-HN-5-11]WNM31548.1 hypothetical protein RKE30_14585 [Streptomyces sp. Li-HN-5-11]